MVIMQLIIEPRMRWIPERNEVSSLLERIDVVFFIVGAVFHRFEVCMRAAARFCDSELRHMIES